MESLVVEIQQYAADAAWLAKQSTSLAEHVAVRTGDVSTATRVRVIEKTDHDTLHKDYSVSIDALVRAVQGLTKQAVPLRKLLRCFPLPWSASG